jgi:hypothetical protein
VLERNGVSGSESNFKKKKRDDHLESALKKESCHKIPNSKNKRLHSPATRKKIWQESSLSRLRTRICCRPNQLLGGKAGESFVTCEDVQLPGLVEKCKAETIMKKR